jgi:hypothetical protein
LRLVPLRHVGVETGLPAAADDVVVAAGVKPPGEQDDAFARQLPHRHLAPRGKGMVRGDGDDELYLQDVLER